MAASLTRLISVYRRQLFNPLEFSSFVTRCVNVNHQNYRKFSSQNLSPAKSQSFKDVQMFRRDQAERTLLISGSTVELLDFCQNYGNIMKAYLIKQNTKQYMLVEFSDVSSLKRLLVNVNHFPNERKIPIESHLLYFRPGHSRLHSSNFRSQKYIISDLDACRLTDEDLHSCLTISSQISLLHKRLSLTDVDIRLRHFLCGEIERFLGNLFPNAAVHMFGSSVNGFGRFDCDVDMTLDLDEKTGHQNVKKLQPGSLYYRSKMKPDNDRFFNQKSLDVIGGMLQLFMPMTTNIQRILKARVPIVKFHFISCSLECDLCLGNRSAIEMSKALYDMLNCDERVGPLVFTIRHWARHCGITQASPGPWLSNFMLTLLVVYSLQAMSNPILQPLKKVIEGSSLLSRGDSSQSTPSLEDLLLQFFKFYANADLSRHAISVIDGCFLPKPDQSPLFIFNPIETELNVSKNVLDLHLEKFQVLCQEAYDSLTSQSSLKTADNKPWGLLTILKINEPIVNQSEELLSTDEIEPVVHADGDLAHIEGLPSDFNTDVDRYNTKNPNQKLKITMRSILDDTELADTAKLVRRK